MPSRCLPNFLRPDSLLPAFWPALPTRGSAFFSVSADFRHLSSDRWPDIIPDFLQIASTFFKISQTIFACSVNSELPRAYRRTNFKKKLRLVLCHSSGSWDPGFLIWNLDYSRQSKYIFVRNLAYFFDTQLMEIAGLV